MRASFDVECHAASESPLERDILQYHYQVLLVIKDTMTSSNNAAKSSNSIPFPESHISRTPSEVQLAYDTLEAENADERVYKRIIVGMRNQMIRQFEANGAVNPLHMQSLNGVKNTKHANDDELTTMHMHTSRHSERAFGYSIGEQDENTVVSTRTSSSTQQGGIGGRQASMNANMCFLTSCYDEQNGHNCICIFDLEM